MCGIYGFSGNKKPNLAKLKILGIFNVKRGRDSTGYFYNGQLHKGAEVKTREFPDFIQHHIIQDVGKPKSNVFIGHTRQASVGATNIDNCHPFNIQNKYILAHNGTIDNIWELCEKYDVDTVGINVDSKALGLLYDKVGPSILNEYRGYAALLIHDLRDASSLYVYHGASKQYMHGQVIEERPLYGMKTREGYYFSSQEEGLLAIRDTEGQEPFEVETNKLIQVRLDDYGYNVIDVDRESNNLGLVQKKTTYYPPTTVITTPTGGVGGTRLLDEARSACGTKAIPYVFQKSMNIAKETLPVRNFILEENNVEEYVIYWKGRYFDQNQNLLTGVYYLNPDGWIYEELGPGIYEHYFYQGVMLDGKYSHERIQNAINEKNSFYIELTNQGNNFAKAISSMSKYPVTNLETESKGIFNEYTRFSWYKGHLLAAGGYTPLFSDRDYTFKAGELHNVVNNKFMPDSIFVTDGHTIYDNVNLEGTRTTPVVEKKKENEDIVKSVPFENGIVIHINKDLSFLKAYFKRKWQSTSEIENAIPYCIYLAIKIYLKDIFTACDTPPTESDIDDAYNQFLETAINDEESFYDLMSKDFKSIDDYIKLALEEEANTSNTALRKAEDDYCETITFEDIEDINQQAYKQSLRDMAAERLQTEQIEMDDAYNREIEQRELNRTTYGKRSL